MIKLNKMTDYAAVVMGIMALDYRHGGIASISASDLSSRSGLGQATVAKIMKQLAHAGLVASTRGKDGGYRLCCAPEHIAVSAIVEAMEGPIAVTSCVETSADRCASRHSCFLGGSWEKVNSAIASALSGVTLADLTNPEDHFISDPALPEIEPMQGSVSVHVGNS